MTIINKTDALSEPRDAATLNKLMFVKLMPLLIAAYVLSFLDRTNIALAKHQLDIDLGISAAAYGLGAGLFFLTYALSEVPSNLIMHKVGARFWIARIMVTWGLISAAMAFVQGETSFYVLRLLLGIAEAGLFPGVMLYLTYWFGREQRARATGYFLLGVCFANIIGGPLGAALMQLDGVWGWRGWQWMFMLEGLPAVFFAVVVWKKLPDRPSKAPWLSVAEAEQIERTLAAEAQEGAGQGGNAFKQCLTPQILLAILVYFCHQITVYTVIFFLPGIIGKYGDLSTLQIGLLTSLPWLAAAVGAIALPRFATTPQRSRQMLVVGLLTMAAGLGIASFAGPAVSLLGFCISAVMFFVVQSIIFLYPASRLKGAALAGGLGFVNSCGLLGGFVGPSVMGLIEQSTGNAMDGMKIIAIVLVIAAIAAMRLRQGHERKVDKQRLQGRRQPV
ncbi:MFS transporter [Pseudomonas psychrophila]|uniref:Sugar phosphate permease n=1 Tax=Pseudomonas psychrophila TaxID=122355 RepID=A0ABY0VXE0_9PSED|nr:MFS transporter [Pseudomonas psychrophila]KAB0492353.1 MFS transporter [Pseudomonas psychrophila]KMM98544.1 membrane protein [Pseudomonas psychrophila]QIE33513.1 MFS transporter [Pseudomonas psychrophila]WVI95593.1 MFS transporter [Pseudomonas psychrophila]SDU61863.1 Sugar phosphate permease [Pseudomonas psychrophila]